MERADKEFIFFRIKICIAERLKPIDRRLRKPDEHAIVFGTLFKTSVAL